ncbi:2-amino-4-hydroxy-6-hydroxymethyldihydropteridine diphosphokinase [Cellulomonas composti]|uniref:Bifunctional folate synthesis protein n=1 Tax=Cellulomonas composti TaxID=266130 RepID=A0A511JCK9_9CELL|nr:2-amino-4-hydroxy-6-hydroxymethyldihydropteridine diphosphokinase [Cellulomonas composti]GEL95714.1 hypothetical protein CCO02nite_23720 [Cellulomonas composti]
MSETPGVLDAQGHLLDRIRLTGLSATGYHGVFEHERREGQTFVADVVVHLDTRRAAAQDDLRHTLDYGDVASKVVAVLEGEPVDLVETLAEIIAATVLANGSVQAVDVTVHKPQAPITVPFEDVTVSIRRDRSKLPAAEPYSPVPVVTLAPDEAAPDEPAPDEPAPDETAPAAAVPPTAALAEAAPAEPGRLLVPAAAPMLAPVRAAEGQGDVEDAASADEVVVGEVVTDVLDREPDGPVDAVLALGANLGNAQETLRAAVSALAATPGVVLVDVSPLARTAPVGGPQQPDFLNAVVLVRTTLSPRGLLRATQAIEQQHGRERHEHWGPRTLDVDIVVYGQVLATTDDLELPHPRAHERAFVLQPWAQADPHAVLPGLGGGPVAALAATAPDRAGVRWLALDWLTAPVSAAQVDADTSRSAPPSRP